MPTTIDRETKEQIVVLRALDYSKSDIGEKLDISRHTVRSHLKQIREQVEENTDRKSALVRYLNDESIEPYDDITSVQKSDDNNHVF